MATTMTRAEREAFLADVHVGVLAIAEPGRGQPERWLSVDYRKAFA